MQNNQKIFDILDEKIDKTIKNILSYYYLFASKEDYIPAVVNVGNLFGDGCDLYAKLIFVSKEHEVCRTWMKQNLIKDTSDGVFNLIVQYNYKFNNIYGINPMLMDETDVVMIEQTNPKIMNLVYDDNESINKKNILIYEDENIFIYYPMLKKYLDEYNLYLEFEYRQFKDGLDLGERSYFKTDAGFFDITYNLNDGFIGQNRNLYWLRGTIKVKIGDNIPSKNDDEYSVVSLSNGNIRKLNTSNYNDDVDAGLIVFSIDAIDIIKKYYFIYDLVLVPKIKGIRKCIVDILDNNIVFWEGEFNSKLPSEMKNALKKYNISNKTSNIISRAMYEWQLMGKWDIDEYLYPNQLLAKYIRSNYYELAVEKELDFYRPSNLEELKLFINKIFDLTKFNLDNEKMNPDKKNLLKSILLNKYSLKDLDDLYNIYQGFCYFMYKVMKNEVR